MSWHLILMICLSILYLSYRIYCYSTSIEFSYYKKQKELTKWEWFWINTKRHIFEWEFIIKGYWRWYKFKHIWPIVIGWLIYGGIFIW
jgi:hypothetical protein